MHSTGTALPGPVTRLQPCRFARRHAAKATCRERRTQQAVTLNLVADQITGRRTLVSISRMHLYEATATQKHGCPASLHSRAWHSSHLDRHVAGRAYAVAPTVAARLRSCHTSRQKPNSTPKHSCSLVRRASLTRAPCDRLKSIQRRGGPPVPHQLQSVLQPPRPAARPVTLMSATPSVVDRRGGCPALLDPLADSLSRKQRRHRRHARSQPQSRRRSPQHHSLPTLRPGVTSRLGTPIMRAASRTSPP